MATKIDTQTIDADAEISDIATLDDRDVRALTEFHSVLDDIGRVKDAPGLYLVVSQSGCEYLVDAHDGGCECADSEYHNPDGGCKHLRRIKFATGLRPIPADVDRSAIDPSLGEHVEGPHFVDD